MAKAKSDKIILKIFDSKISSEKKPHNCPLCQVYKREIHKGNTEALEFFKTHINEVVKKNSGATIVIEKQYGMKMLAAANGVK
jgi:hypothetical protein